MIGNNNPATASGYAEGDDLQRRVNARHRSGTMWRVAFQAATIVGIIALIALLYNILNQTFGLIAVQNQVDPRGVVLAVEQENMLEASHLVTSEDDNELAAGISGSANAIGFFGYTYYRDNNTTLRALTVDGVEATAETVEDGDYPLARPLFIYTTADIMRQKPEVAVFVNYYLTRVNEEIDAVGYFPATADSQREDQAEWLEASSLEGDGLPAVNPAQVGGDITIAGSSTVFPLTSRLAERFQAEGYTGQLIIDNIGSTAGLHRFCVEGTVDIANASRTIYRAELDACRANNRRPEEFLVGADALVVVVSQENTFLTDVTVEELRQLFTTAVLWSEVNPNWPAEPIERFIPGEDSGTLNFFAETVFDRELEDLPKETLIEILAANISVGLGRRLENEQRFYEDRLIFDSPERFTQVCAGDSPPTGCTLPARDQEDVYLLVLERVIQPKVVRSWSFVDSITKRTEIAQETLERYPDAELEFRSWLTPRFVRTPQSSTAEFAGVRTAIFGSLWVVLITIVFSFPVGVSAAIYLEEYASDNAINRILQTNINNLAGVPSIIYGMLGLAIFVRMLEPITSGALFGAVADTTTANGRTILSAGLTLGLLILPLIIINAQEAIRAVPSSLRQASYGLGATKWQTIWYHVLPNALPGILTGTILALSRAIGETAPLVVVGASTFITVDPTGPFSKFTTLPIQIYQWTSRPQGEFRNIAAAAIVVLLALLLTLNATAVILRNRYSKQMV